MDATFKFAIGEDVYFEPRFGTPARGQFTIVRLLPVERDNRLRYRVKSKTGVEWVADEFELTRNN